MHLEKDAALRVLVVDDNEDAAAALALLLELWGCDARMALSGDEGLAVACEFGPHALLLDIGMPGMSGCETARRWRAVERSTGRDAAMLVAVTGYGARSDAQAALRAGFDYHLVKPTNASDLQRLLYAYASRCRSEAAVAAARGVLDRGASTAWRAGSTGYADWSCHVGDVGAKS